MDDAVFQCEYLLRVSNTVISAFLGGPCNGGRAGTFMNTLNKSQHLKGLRVSLISLSFFF